MGRLPNIIAGGGASNRKPQAKYFGKGNNQLVAMKYLCDQVTLPGLNLQTNDRPGYSPVATTKIPGVIEYGELNASFICRDWMSERELFDDWILGIKNAYSGGAGPTYDNAYMNDYVIDASIFVLSLYNDGNPDPDVDRRQIGDAAVRYAVALRDLYPTNIEVVQLNWQEDSPMRMNITFAYSYWEPIIGGAQYAHEIPMASKAVEPGISIPDLGPRVGSTITF